MQTYIRELRRRDDDEGFTLIELMVVVLIIALLIAIAIPTFLGARNRAYDRATQASLRNALTAAKTSFTDTGDYGNATVANLTAIEPSLSFIVGASTGAKSVSVVAPAAGQSTWWAVAMSKSNKCFGIEDQSGNGLGTTYAGSTTVLAVPCTAPAADPHFPDTAW